MSDPTKELQKLSLGGGMTTMRQQAQQARRERERRERQRLAQERMSQQGPPAATPLLSGPSVVQGHSGILYSLRAMSPRSQVVAAKGLRTDSFMVDLSRKHEFDDSHSVCAFQLREAHSVRVFDPAGGNRRVTCTCEEFSRDPTTAVCAHIYWLYDGLNDVLACIPHNTTPEQTVDRVNVERRFTELYDEIDSKLDRLPDMLNNIWDEEEDEDAYETIQDMLAVLDPENFWDNYDDDFEALFPEVSSKCFQDLVVPGSMPVTIYGLAKHDPIFRERLRNAIPKDMCAKDLMTKLKGKTSFFFGAFDDYVRRGPKFDPHFVARTASSLRHVISKLSTYRKGERAPMSSSFDRNAAELALFILEEVAKRNKDIYMHSSWQTTEDDPEDERDCNIFVNLIKSPVASASTSTFVLDFLVDELAPAAFKHLLSRLESLVVKLQQQDAPEAYVKKLVDAISTSETEEGEPEGYEQHLAGPGHRQPSSPDDPFPHSQSPRPSVARRPTLDGPEPQRRRLA